MTRFPSALEHLTEKPCAICGGIIKRDKFASDYHWEHKKYCLPQCQYIGSAIATLKKAGYTVEKNI